MRSAACIVWGALGLLSGCAGAQAHPSPTAPEVSSREAVAHVEVAPSLDFATRAPAPRAADLEGVALRAVDAAWRARDAEKVGSAYTRDARVVFPGSAGANGKAAIQEAARAFWDAFPDAKVAWSRSWRTAGVAIVESAWTGTNTGPLPGAKATHRSAGGVALTLSWFSPEGLIREQHVYADAGSIATQLGLVRTGVDRAKVRILEGLPTSHEEHAASGTVVEEANVELVRAGFDRQAQRDAKGALSWIAEDAEYVDFTGRGSRKGKGAVERWFRAVTNHSADAPETTTLWGIEDYVIREYDSKTGDGRAAVPRGVRRTRGVDVFQIRDGKVVRGWGYANALETSPELGLGSALSVAGHEDPALHGR